MKKIIHELNIIINQKNYVLVDAQQEENGNIGRYYDYEGYETIEGQCLATYIYKNDQLGESPEMNIDIPITFNSPKKAMKLQNE